MIFDSFTFLSKLLETCEQILQGLFSQIIANKNVSLKAISLSGGSQLGEEINVIIFVFSFTLNLLESGCQPFQKRSSFCSMLLLYALPFPKSTGKTLNVLAESKISITTRTSCHYS